MSMQYNIASTSVLTSSDNSPCVGTLERSESMSGTKSAVTSFFNHFISCMSVYVIGGKMQKSRVCVLLIYTIEHEHFLSTLGLVDKSI